MSNEPSRTPDLQEVDAIAQQFVKSGYFSDAKSAAQAVVKIYAGAELGITPFASMSGIHIIQGKPVYGAGMMASLIKGSGKYRYKIREHSDKQCIIDFHELVGSEWEHIGESSFTAEEAKKAGTKNMDKFPKNMLFARALSNGAKWHCPDIFMGSAYVEGEIEPTPASQPRTEEAQWAYAEEEPPQPRDISPYFQAIDELATTHQIGAEKVDGAKSWLEGQADFDAALATIRSRWEQQQEQSESESE